MALKITGLVFVILAGAMGGSVFAENLGNKTAYLSTLCTLLDELTRAVQHHDVSVMSVLNSSRAANKLFNGTVFNVQSDLPLQYKNAIVNSNQERYLSPAEEESLQHFFSNFGSEGKEEELEKLAVISHLVKTWQASAQQEEQLNAKLYRSAGLYAGLALAIILA